MYKGGQLQSKDSYLCGRFECGIRPAIGSGIISSFFLFADNPYYKINWQELDFEFLGKYTNQVQTNVITTVVGRRKESEINTLLPKESSSKFWKLGIEWSPKKVVWYIDDLEVRSLDIILPQSMKLMMNCWSGFPGWSGILHDGMLPQKAEYSYIRYTPCINGKFVGEKAWQDSFDNLDTNKWEIPTHVIGGTQLVKENVSVSNGNLILKLNA